MKINAWLIANEPLLRLIYRLLILIGLAMLVWELYGSDEYEPDDTEGVETVLLIRWEQGDTYPAFEIQGLGLTSAAAS